MRMQAVDFTLSRVHQTILLKHAIYQLLWLSLIYYIQLISTKQHLVYQKHKRLLSGLTNALFVVPRNTCANKMSNICPTKSTGTVVDKV